MISLVNIATGRFLLAYKKEYFEIYPSQGMLTEFTEEYLHTVKYKLNFLKTDNKTNDSISLWIHNSNKITLRSYMVRYFENKTETKFLNKYLDVICIN